MFSAVNQFCQNYYDQLPADGLRSIGLSAAVSFAASVVIISINTPINAMPESMARVGLATGISFLAATIHVLTTPIFNYLFDNPNNEFNGYQEFLRMLIDITLVHCLINNTTAYKINLITSRDFKNGNFMLLPHNILKVGVDISLRMYEFIGVPPVLLNVISDFFKNTLHMDFNQNSSPIFVSA